MEDVQYFIMRRRKKITLKQISEACECSIALLSLYENDKANMSPNKVATYKKFILNY